jgi:hypothetical protein
MSLRQRVKASKTGTVTDVPYPDDMADSRRPPTTIDEWLTAKKCTTDVVVDGLVSSGVSSLTTDETAVFTELEIQLEACARLRSENYIVPALADPISLYLRRLAALQQSIPANVAEAIEQQTAVVSNRRTASLAHCS